MRKTGIVIGSRVVVPAPSEPVPGEREWWARSWEPSYRELELDQLGSARELAEVVHDAAAQLGTGHAWTQEGDPGQALRQRSREWLDRSEPRLREATRQMTEDLLEAWELFRGRRR